MSIINNMLKDLEARKGQTFVNHALPKAYAITTKNFFTWPKKFIVLVLATIMTLIIIWNWPKSKSHLAFLPQPTQHETIANNNLDLIWLKPATVSAATVQVKENITELSFLLDHPILYHLESDADTRHLKLVLENSDLKAALPPFKYLETSVSDIKAEQKLTDTYLSVALNEGAYLSQIKMNTFDDKAELILAIATVTPPTKNPNDNQTQGTRFDKTPALQSLLIEQYQKALQHAAEGHFSTAIKSLENLLKAENSYDEARTTLVALLMQQGAITKANQVLEAGLKTNPIHLPFIELKSRLLLIQGESNKALSLLLNYAPSFSENLDYYALVAALYERNNQDKLAVKTYRELLNSNPDNGNWWAGLAVSLEKLNQTKLASSAFAKALEKGNLNNDTLNIVQNHLQNLQGIS